MSHSQRERCSCGICASVCVCVCICTRACVSQLSVHMYAYVEMHPQPTGLVSFIQLANCGFEWVQVHVKSHM